MATETILMYPIPGPEALVWPGPQSGDTDRSLDDFLHARPRILRGKLELMAAEIMERFRIHDQNLDRIQDDTGRLREMIGQVTMAAGYGTRRHSDKGPLYKTLFDLQKQERDQDTECWKDVVGVMRDFLTVWEAHEQARSRAILLEGDHA